MSSSRSKVEVGLTQARCNGFFMHMVSLGHYPDLIRKIVDEIDIKPAQLTLNLESGTGRNDRLMAKNLGPWVRISGLDISTQMQSPRWQPEPILWHLAQLTDRLPYIGARHQKYT